MIIRRLSEMTSCRQITSGSAAATSRTSAVMRSAIFRGSNQMFQVRQRIEVGFAGPCEGEAAEDEEAAEDDEPVPETPQ